MCIRDSSVTICVIDVRCGNNLTKVELCHVPPDNPLNPGTLCVSQTSVAMHLAHGDQLAACGTDHSCPPAVQAYASTVGSGPVLTNNGAPLLSTEDATLMNGNLLKETTLLAY